MPPESTLRRRGRPSAPAEPSTTTDVTTETADPQHATSPAAPTPSTKTVPELLDEEKHSMSNFLMIAAAVALFFIFMIQTTPMPPPGRVLGIMIDAGSTGTRAQLFSFRRDPASGSLVLQSTQMFTIDKSLAALATGTAASATQFFRPLLDKVKKATPGVRRRKRTPIALRATAGLRLLGDVAAENALAHAREALHASEFLFRDEWVSVLDEEDEAVHAWTTVNYLLGNVGNNSRQQADTQYYGALELGGGSMQIVFNRAEDQEIKEETEIDMEDDDGNESAEADLMDSDTTFDVLGSTYQLHSTSYLGLGLFDFTKKLYLLFDREGVLEEGNPCFRKDKLFEKKMLRFGVPGSEESRVVTMTGDGDFERCVASAEITIATFSKLYKMKRKLPPNMPFYAFAYFYDRTVGLGLPSSPSKKQLIAKGKKLCEAHPDIEVRGDTDEACAEFSYVFALLKHFTNDFSTKDAVRIQFKQFVDGHMLGWALGAMLDTVQPVMNMQLSLDEESLIIGS